MVKHKMDDQSILWAPPGGGLDFGDEVHKALQREVYEETGLEVDPGRLSFVCEFISGPLHALELFFEVTQKGGEPVTGFDPEMPVNNQIIQQVKFMDWDEIMSLERTDRHGIFNLENNLEKFKKLSGFYRI